MRDLDPGLAQHISGEALTLCSCWQIIRADGTVMGFTDHDRDISFDGVVHESLSGFEPTAMESSIGLSPGSQEIAGALQSDKITEKDIFSRKYDGARLRHFTVNWQTPSERLLTRTLLFGEITREGSAFRAELRSVTAMFDQTTGRRFEKQCSADLGDVRCKVNLGGLQASGSVLRVLDGATLEVSGLDGHAASRFRAGRLTFTGGANQGQSVEISDHRQNGDQPGAILALWCEPAEAVTPGDTFDVTPGCDKTFATCCEKFANGLNYQGFPHIPPRGFALSYASNSENMDGGALVK